MADTLSIGLSENLITLLAFNAVQGRVVAGIVDPALFEGEYREIAERSIAFWQKFDEPPGTHLPDIFADYIDDPGNRKGKLFVRIFENMRALSAQVNEAYVMDQLRRFTRVQKIKAAIVKSAEAINANPNMETEEVEDLWSDVLRRDDFQFDAGMRLTESERFWEYRETILQEFETGIDDLDDQNITPQRGKVFMLLGAAGRGKTWFLTHIGRKALQRRKKIVHISLEISEEETAERYYMGLFGISGKANDRPTVTTILRDDRAELEAFDFVKVDPEFSFEGEMARDDLNAYLDFRQGLYDKYLVMKRFAPRSVRIKDIRAWLDNLEATTGFIPDMIILDYVGILKTNPTNHRIELGREMEEFRALCVDRHMAGVTVHQVSKIGAHSELVSSTHVAEDWSLVQTADFILTYSSTDAEAEFGLGRLYVSKARRARDRWGLLITQNYALGHFVLDAVKLRKSYWDIFKEQTGADAEEMDKAA